MSPASSFVARCFATSTTSAQSLVAGQSPEPDRRGSSPRCARSKAGERLSSCCNPIRDSGGPSSRLGPRPLAAHDPRRLDARGWDSVDVIIVWASLRDHPALGPAVVGRMIEREGLRVATSPSRTRGYVPRDSELGAPRLFFGVTGCGRVRLVLLGSC